MNINTADKHSNTSKLKGKSHVLTLYYTNIGSLRKKYLELEIFLEENKNIDLLCLTEHFLFLDEINYYNFKNFNLASSYCRKFKKQGGVSIYIKDNIQFLALENISKHSVELDFEIVGIKLVNINQIILCIYRSPDGDINTFFSKLDLVLSIIVKTNSKILISGDFNIDILDKSKNAQTFHDIIESHGIVFTNFNYTRFSYKNKGSCIDNILTNLNPDCYAVNVNKYQLSDHKALTLEFLNDIDIEKQDDGNVIQGRIINKNNMTIFRSALSECDWSEVLGLSHDANKIFDVFLKLFMSKVNRLFPITHLRQSKRNKSPPIRFTPELKYYREILHLFEKLKLVDIKYTNIYKKIRQKYRFLLKQNKTRTNDEQILKAENKNKAMWNIIKRESGQNKNKIMPAHNLTANDFNDYFANIAEKIYSSLPASKKDPLDFLEKVKQPPNSFFLTPVTEFEIENIINNLKQSNSTDIFELNTKVVKLVADYISVPLTHILNICFEEGIFPNSLKVSKVIPIYKKGDPNLPSNYRPISLVPVFSKIFEHALKTRLMTYFEKYNLFTCKQFGFRQNRSTTLAAVKLIDEIIDKLEQGHTVVGNLKDLTKAFDCVPHDTLGGKLFKYGVRDKGLAIIMDFLTGRSQVVFSGGKFSEVQFVTAGVPQGSVLGPPLFIIDFNDMDANIDTYKVEYADDATYVNSSDTLPELEAKINNTENQSDAWFVANKLLVNKDKCQNIVFSLSKTLKIDLPNMEEEVKFLGFNLDAQLNWKNHIDAVTKKINIFNFMLRKIISSVSLNTALTTYFAYAQSVLQYGIILWGNSTDWERVFRAQKTSLRILSKKSKRYSCRQLFIDLQILTFPSLYIYHTLLYAKQNFHEYKKNNSYHSYATRINQQIRLPTCRLNLKKKTPYVMGAVFYNKLSEAIQNLNIIKFKRVIKKFLLEKAYYSINDFLQEEIEITIV